MSRAVTGSRSPRSPRSSRASRMLGRSSGAGVAVLLACVGLVAACGSRGPLDDDGPLDAGVSADGAVTEATLEDVTPPPADAPVEAAQEAGSIIGCGTCLVGSCSQGILTCVQTPACQATLQCVATTCLTSGAPSPACLFTCASGSVSTALQIFNIFQCVTGTCGTDCNPVLGGLLGGAGGGGGGGGTGGGTKDAGLAPKAAPVPAFARVLYSHWPELMTPVDGVTARSQPAQPASH